MTKGSIVQSETTSTTPLIHIGFHKTGTTWLQHRFFNCEPIFGVISRHREVDEQIIRPHGLDFDADRVRAHFATALSEASQAGRVPVISTETLCGNPFYGGRESYEIAERLKSVFPDAKILITVRRQISILVSTYKQYISRGGTENFPEFFFPNADPGYFFFDYRHYEFDRLAVRYAQLFGSVNVRVMLHEDLTCDSFEFCRQIASFATGRPEPAIRRPDPTPYGVSSSDHILPILRRLNHFRASPLNPAPCLQLGRFADYAYRLTNRFGGALYRRSGADPRQSALRNYVTRHFGDAYRESNARLSRMIGRDLSMSGYPTTDQEDTYRAACLRNVPGHGMPASTTTSAASQQGV